MYADVNGTRLYYETMGSGPPLMLMHGGLGMDNAHFRPWFEELADELTVIFYDHRGNGRSERPSDWNSITHDTWADDADALREHLGFDRMTLLGHSYGGFLAQEYVLRHGERLSSVILSCTAPALDYPEVVMANAAARGTQEQVDALGRELANPSDKDEDYRALMQTIMSLYWVEYDPAVGADLDARTHYSGGGFAHAFRNCLPTFNLVPRLHEITAPTLILSGREDWITPPKEGGERIAAEIPSSRMVIFERSGHFPYVEEQDEYFNVVREWIREHP